MWRLHRYYLRELLINAAITFAVLFAIVVISLVARGIQRAQGGVLRDAALITIFWALDSFPHLLPISFLLATVLTFARAAQDREITAIRSAGISPRVPMTAVVLVGIALSIVGSLGLHFVLPDIHFRKYRIIAEAVRNVIQNMGLGSGDDRVTIPHSDVTMTFGQREDSGSDGVSRRDCWLFLRDARRIDAVGFKSPIVHVDRISIQLPDDTSTSLVVLIENCRDPLTGVYAKELRPSFPLQTISEENRRNDRDDDVVSSQLLSEVLRGHHEAPTAAIYTLNRRTCFALLPLLLGPIGFCIALLARERGRALAIVFALVPLVVFYAGDVFGAKLLRATDWPGFGWLPAALLLLLGAPFCWRELRR